MRRGLLFLMAMVMGASVLLGSNEALAQNCPRGFEWDSWSGVCVERDYDVYIYRERDGYTIYEDHHDRYGEPYKYKEYYEPAPKPAPRKRASCDLALGNCNAVCAQNHARHRDAGTYQTCLNNCMIGYNFCN